MKVFAPCITCLKEASAKIGTGESTSVRFLYGEMDDNGLVYQTCDTGHKTIAVHQSPKHRVLFESGCHALLDHYTNEAVSTCSAALERTYEFFLRVAYRKLRLSSSLLDASWKQVKAQSERQLGAFFFLFPVIAGEPFELPVKITELRNSVIHRGYIARFDEVLGYAASIFALIRSIMHVLSDICPTEMWAEINEAAEVQKSAVPAGIEWTWVGGTEFDLNVDFTFESWMDELRGQHGGQPV